MAFKALTLTITNPAQAPRASRARGIIYTPYLDPGFPNICAAEDSLSAKALRLKARRRL